MFTKWEFVGLMSYHLTSPKRKPKPRTKRWDNLDPNDTSETEDEANGMVQKEENNGTQEVMNQNIHEDIREEAPIQCNANAQKDYGLVKYTDITLGGEK